MKIKNSWDQELKYKNYIIKNIFKAKTISYKNIKDVK